MQTTRVDPLKLAVPWIFGAGDDELRQGARDQTTPIPGQKNKRTRRAEQKARRTAIVCRVAAPALDNTLAPLLQRSLICLPTVHMARSP